MAEGDHIVMLPFMAQGHLTPFLALASLISGRFPRCTITLLTTPLNAQALRSSLPPNPRITLHPLPFRGSDFGLPPGSENTDSLPTPLLIRLFLASESLAPHFASFVSARPPLLIVADLFFGWTVDIARGLGASHVSFTTCGAYGTAAFSSLWLNLPHASTDSPYFHIPGFPASCKLHRSQLSSYMRAADGRDPWSIFFRRQISLSLNSDAMLCNTVEGVEVEGLRLLRASSKLRVWPVGPLLGRSGKRPGMDASDVMKWMGLHGPGSVVYVSFGSQNTISGPQMLTLAAGLESSGRAFIWVVRPPVGFDLGSDFRSEWLPDGFESRVNENKQGLLVMGWAPQLEILSHESVGAFLTHCGWNSVLESLSRGVAMIGWPVAAEQFYNSKMVVEELGVGVELARGVTDEVRSEEVALVRSSLWAALTYQDIKVSDHSRQCTPSIRLSKSSDESDISRRRRGPRQLNPSRRGHRVRSKWPTLHKRRQVVATSMILDVLKRIS